MEPSVLVERARRGGLVSDYEFDSWLPDFARCNSERHWTRVGVAMRASQWLAERGVRRVLDVGSGVGKFCIAGAMRTNLSFVGIEHRGELVAAARELAALFKVQARATFVCADFGAVDSRGFDAFYFYNPFEENLASPAMRIDDTVELNLTRFRRSTRQAEDLLHRAPVGTYVVTYNGFGGRIPETYRLFQAKSAGRNVLRLWRKVDALPSSHGGYWLELEDTTVLRSGPGRRSPSVGPGRRSRDAHHLRLIRE